MSFYDPPLEMRMFVDDKEVRDDNEVITFPTELNHQLRCVLGPSHEPYPIVVSVDSNFIFPDGDDNSSMIVKNWTQKADDYADEGLVESVVQAEDLYLSFFQYHKPVTCSASVPGSNIMRTKTFRPEIAGCELSMISQSKLVAVVKKLKLVMAFE